jgi:hypothetical protein
VDPLRDHPAFAQVFVLVTARTVISTPASSRIISAICELSNGNSACRLRTVAVDGVALAFLLSHRRERQCAVRPGYGAAMRPLHAGIDTSVIALWLGHEQIETTQIYLHADLQLKERTLARVTPVNILPGRYRPSDKLLAFLEAI